MPQVADGPLYEVVNGQRVELAPMGVRESWIAKVLAWYLQAFAQPRRLGRAVVEILFDLAPVGKERRPDVAFVSSPRWPFNLVPPAGDNAWKVIPNLAAEVVSPPYTATWHAAPCRNRQGFTHCSYRHSCYFRRPREFSAREFHAGPILSQALKKLSPNS